MGFEVSHYHSTFTLSNLEGISSHNSENSPILTTFYSPIKTLVAKSNKSAISEELKVYFVHFLCLYKSRLFGHSPKSLCSRLTKSDHLKENKPIKRALLTPTPSVTSSTIHLFKKIFSWCFLVFSDAVGWTASWRHYPSDLSTLQESESLPFIISEWDVAKVASQLPVNAICDGQTMNSVTSFIFLFWLCQDTLEIRLLVNFSQVKKNMDLMDWNKSNMGVDFITSGLINHALPP
ncbi:hypothetical protein EGR_07602 [Echinococcus granulosus]|uniref:Uncharacterized protein n=1 Tax=Echinococcus granulosus TaxID=6210 RepID=W6UAG2_ECHGR|nr:hypothetical protein EGR_07602 [Echinococcus granulosus]EUB57511.1 hypothetical protein EGR_07602 [Echinococcus granulosus]